MAHTTHVTQEATALDRRSVRAVCTCGWYGTPFLPGEERDAWLDGRKHERDERDAATPLGRAGKQAVLRRLAVIDGGDA